MINWLIDNKLKINIIMFVHGRNESPTDFSPLIKNIIKFSNNETKSDIVKLDDNFYILGTIDLGLTAHKGEKEVLLPCDMQY